MSLLFAGCGDSDTGAVEGQPVVEQADGQSKAAELSREGRMYPTDKILDYSMDEDGEEGGKVEISPEEEEKLLMDVDEEVEKGGKGAKVVKATPAGSTAGGEGGQNTEEKNRDEVFLSKEEQEKAKEEERLVLERKKAERKADYLRKRQEAREACQTGREIGSRNVKSRIDNRYFVVRSIRSAKQVGRELNRGGNREDGGQEGEMGGFHGEDERWLRNYNIHSVEKGVNVSCSFNPRSGLCYTCLGEPHRAWEGREGQPVVVVLADQSFPANVPAADGGECIRIVRVEDGSLHELTSELTGMLINKKVLPGTVIMLGSMTQLARYGTAWYTSEWLKARNVLKRELGDVLVVPLLPLVSEDLWGSHLVRSLTEFLNWMEDLQDPEVELLRSVRRQYMADFLSVVEGGGALGR